MASERNGGEAKRNGGGASNSDAAKAITIIATSAVTIETTEATVDLVALLEPENRCLVTCGEFGPLTDGERRLLIPILETALVDIRMARKRR